MPDKPPGYYSDTDTIVVPFIFVPDGQPLPEEFQHFRDPIILRARFEPEPSAPAPLPRIRPTVRTIPGSAAPIPVHAPLRQQSERPAIRSLSQDVSSGNGMIAYNQCVSECADLYEDGL